MQQKRRKIGKILAADWVERNPHHFFIHYLMRSPNTCKQIEGITGINELSVSKLGLLSA